MPHFLALLKTPDGTNTFGVVLVVVVLVAVVEVLVPGVVVIDLRGTPIVVIGETAPTSYKGVLTKPRRLAVVEFNCALVTQSRYRF